MISRREKFISFVIYAAIALTLVKIIAVVFSSPLMGYANNYDFLRQSSCVGIWQSYPDKPKTSSNPTGPLNSLVHDGHKDEGLCMKSIDNVFPSIAAYFHDVGASVDFREISFWRVLFSLVLFACLFYVVKGGANRLLLALAFFLTFGDIANLLYANTFYLEYSVISSLFFAVVSSVYLTTSTKESSLLIILAAISILWLGLSKQQYMPLATLLGLLCSAALFLKHGRATIAIAFALVSASIPFAYGYMNDAGSGHMRGVNFANKTDTFLWAVLPEAADKKAALSKLGLPAECIDGIGKSWYSPGVQDNHPCPNVETLSRAKLLGLFVSDPSTFVEPMRKAIIGVHPFYPPYLGHLEDTKDRGTASYQLLKKTSLSDALASIPKNYTPFIFLASMLVGLVAFGAIVVSLSKRTEIRPFLMMLCLGGLVVLYSIASSVFGDGYAELQKHAVGFLVGLTFQIIGAVGFMVHWAMSRRVDEKKAPRVAPI